MFNEFHKQNKEWTLDIYGEGPLEETLKNKVKEHHLESFVNINPYEQDVSTCYLNSSVYLMSSKLEGWGMVIGEAMEYGLPVISFDIASAPELITNNKNGFIVENYNEEQYVSKMLELANNEELLHQMGAAAREASLKRTNQSIVREWITLFEGMKEHSTNYSFFGLYDRIRVGRVRQ